MFNENLNTNIDFYNVLISLHSTTKTTEPTLINIVATKKFTHVLVSSWNYFLNSKVFNKNSYLTGVLVTPTGGKHVGNIFLLGKF